jgi:Glycosyl transferase family 2
MTPIELDPRPTALPQSKPGPSAPPGEPAILVKDLERTPRQRRRPYIALHLKLLFVIGISLAWAGFSLWLSLSWIDTLGQSITMPLAIAVILGIAIIPGYLNANLIASLLIDRPPPLRFDLTFPDTTVVIACFNEEETIEETLDYVIEQDYPGKLRVLVADDGSTDRTAELAHTRTVDRRILERGTTYKAEETLEIGGVERTFKTVNSPSSTRGGGLPQSAASLPTSPPRRRRCGYGTS